MTRLLRAVGALALVAFAGALLAACGGDSEDDPNELLRQTFSGDKKVESGNLSAGFDLRVEGNAQLSQPVSIKLTGPFQTNGRDRLPDFDLNLSFSGGGQSLAAGAVSTGDRGFLKFQNQAYAVPPEIFDQFRKGFEQAQKQEEGRRDQPSLASLGLDPRKWLRNPRVVGDEEVAGTETVHITSEVDVPRFLDDVNTLLKRAGELGVQGSRDVPDEITPEQRRQVERALRSVRFDVWTGKDDKTMRRMTVALGVDSRGQRGNVRLNLQIADLNEEQSIEAPEGARPLSDLQSQLGGLGLGGLGGSGGGSGGSGGGSGGSAGGSSGGSGGSGGGSGSGGAAGGSGGNEQLQAYTQCLQRAGGDAAKAQDCADLLTP